MLQGTYDVLEVETRAMQASPERLQGLAEDFFNRFPVDKNRWQAFNDFREAALFELKPVTLTPIVIQAMEAAESGTERRLAYGSARWGTTAVQVDIFYKLPLSTLVLVGARLSGDCEAVP